MVIIRNLTFRLGMVASFATIVTSVPVTGTQSTYSSSYSPSNVTDPSASGQRSIGPFAILGGSYEATGFMGPTVSIRSMMGVPDPGGALENARSAFIDDEGPDPEAGSKLMGYFGVNGNFKVEIHFKIQIESLKANWCRWIYIEIYQHLRAWSINDVAPVELTVRTVYDKSIIFTLAWTPQINEPKTWRSSEANPSRLVTSIYPERSIPTADVKEALNTAISEYKDRTELIYGKPAATFVAGKIRLSIKYHNTYSLMQFRQLADLLTQVANDLPIHSKKEDCSPIYGYFRGDQPCGFLTIDLNDLAIDPKLTQLEDDGLDSQTGNITSISRH